MTMSDMLDDPHDDDWFDPAAYLTPAVVDGDGLADAPPTSALDELRAIPHWVSWKYVFRPGASKPTKPPVNPNTGGAGSHSDPKTWAAYEKACWRTRVAGLAGVGFVFTDGDGLTGIDLDACRNAETGELEPWASEIIELAETYAEVSPSGTGIRLLARGKVASATKSDAAHVEIYGTLRYLTITGNHIDDTPEDIRPAPQTIERLLARVAAHAPKARSEEQGNRPKHQQIVGRQGEERRRENRPKGDSKSFFRAVNDRALANLDLWVTAIFPSAKFQPSGAFRVTSKSLGRPLQEDIALAPTGIVDFGVADMGDPQQGKRTAIDMAMEWGGAEDATAAAKWLCDKLGVTPEALGWRDDDAAVAELAAQLGRALDDTGAPNSNRHSEIDPLDGFIFDGDVSPEPPPMLVKKLVPLDGICFIGGQSGAGKTFIAVDLAVSLASGEPFFEHKVAERVGVAIFAAEGASTIPNRVAVARNHKAFGKILPIAWLGAVPNLADPREVGTMIGRLRAVDGRFRATHGIRLGAVICDTLAASFNLDDESSNSEAAKTIRAMKGMSDALGVVVLPVHHFGKAAETGLRGASGWRAGCDAVLSVLADRDQTTGVCRNRRIALTKSRVGEEGWLAPFDLRFVELGTDADGEKFGACHVEYGRASEPDCITLPKPKPLARDAKAYLDALHIVLCEKGKKVRPFGSDGPEVVAVDREDVRSEFYRSRPADGEDERKIASARQKAFRRGEDEARDRRQITSYEVGGRFLIWLVKEDAQ